MTDIVEKPKPYQIADSLLEMAQDVEIGHADRLGVPAASFLRESADCISRQNDEIERLRAALPDAERIRRLELALDFYARCGDVVDDVALAARGDIDLARASEALTEDCGDVARRALEGKDE